jgi:hypothetical protein
MPPASGDELCSSGKEKLNAAGLGCKFVDQRSYSVLQDADSLPKDPSIDWLARALGVGGLGVAIFNLYSARQKAKRDRDLSIDDEYWLRKVLTPTVIEPILERISVLLDATPSSYVDQEAVKSFAVRITTVFQPLRKSVASLAIFDPDLPSKMDAGLEKCEDLMTEYASSLANTEVQLSPQAYADLQSKVWEQLTGTLANIRTSQKAK